MGTRSLTYVHDAYKDEQGETVTEPIVCMYRQFDGYPSGHGAELAKFLLPFVVVNGIPADAKLNKTANGMGCLAAQLVAYFKVECGGFYLHPPILGRNDWQEYEYHVYENYIVVKSFNNDLFTGSWQEFAEFCSSKEIA